MNVKLTTPRYQKYRLAVRCKFHPVYRKALQINYTPIFVDFLDSRLRKFLQNAILSIFGEPGSGKSYVGWSVAECMTKILSKYYNTSFTEDNVYLDIAELSERLQHAKKGEVYMLDEQTDFFGTGSQFVLSTLQNIEMTCRKHQINLIYCAPCVRTHYHNLVLETFLCKWPEQRKTVCEEGYIPFGKTFCFVYGQESKNYLDPLGYIVVNHPKNLEALRAYEKKKDKYIKRALKGDSINLTSIRERIIDEFYESGYAEACRSKKDIKVAIKMLGILPDGAPNTFLDEIAHQIKMERELGITRPTPKYYTKEDRHAKEKRSSPPS